METRVVADGLGFPEGPVVVGDGTVLVVEIQAQVLTRIDPTTGERSTVAELPGGPNGAALGPDGALYVANNGGAFRFDDSSGINVPIQPNPHHGPGSIQRVDLDTGEVTTLYTEADGLALIAPNDLVFDAHGGFYFTDYGVRYERHGDLTGVFYARPDGSGIHEVVHHLDAPNGVGLSPDGSTLYVAETFTGRVWSWPVVEPGRVLAEVPLLHHGGQLVAGLPGAQFLDSLGVEADGTIAVATLVNGGITRISPDGAVVGHVPFPDFLVTNIAWGGDDLRTAYVTCSGTGSLHEVRWPAPGLRLQHQG